MYYLLENTRFDWGDVVFDPPNAHYWGYCAQAPLPEATRVTMHVTSPITRKVHADYIVANRGPFCSSKLKALLEGACSGIHFHHAEICDKKGRRAGKPYFFLHLDEIIPCLDLDMLFDVAPSGFQKGAPVFSEIQSIDDFRLDESLIKGADIFYVSNSPFPSTPVIAEHLASRIVAARCEGVSVLPLDQLKWEDRTLKRK